MKSFRHIYSIAAKRKGGEEALESLLPERKSLEELERMPDDRFLSEMSRCVFKAGFVWRVVDLKWPAFEDVFEEFSPHRISMMADDELDALMKDKRLIRHWRKLKSVRDNAALVMELAKEKGSAGNFFAGWPADDIVGLWDVLKKRGSRLGGMTGPYFLRRVGKDTFLLSPDVVAALVREGVVDKKPTSKAGLRSVQEAFNRWRAESGRSLAAISMVLACGVGD